MKRRIFNADHESLRETATKFFVDEREKNLDRWLADGHVDRDFYRRAGDLGLFGFRVPEELGGAGLDTYTFNVVVSEAAARARVSNVGIRVHSEIVLPYFLGLGTPEQQARFIPSLVAGHRIGAIAMTEPDAGSDLAGIATSARRDGDSYVLRGSKTFITNGANADVVVVVARTDKGSDRRQGLTLIVVEGTPRGFSRGKPMSKLGLSYSDTCELFFDDVRVPVENRLGEQGQAFAYLSSNLPQERVSISVGAVAMSRVALDLTTDYVKGRTMFGSTLGAFQNTKFELADMSTKVDAAEQFLDAAVAELDAGTLSPADAARLKLFCTEVQGKVTDRALQLHGGYGYTTEQPIAGMYADARVTRIYGGSSEVMKVLIARSLGL